jgi:biotin carboxyl carrier protein
MKRLRITIGNKSYEVTVEDLTEAESYRPPPTPGRPSAPPGELVPPERRPASPKPLASLASGAVTSPMAGQIISILVQPGDAVKQGQPLLVLEAMKMENQITAPLPGTVKRIEVEKGESVEEGQVLVVLE